MDKEILSKIDELVLPIVVRFNDLGYKTSMSCQGHDEVDFHGVKVRNSNGYVKIDKVLNWRQKNKIKKVLAEFGITECKFRYYFMWFNRNYRVTKKVREHYLSHGWEVSPKRWKKEYGCPIRHRMFTTVFFPKL